MPTTKASISPAVRGRPGPRWAVPSYLWAISFRCHANSVSGVTMRATSVRTRRVSRLALAGQTPSLIVVEPKPSAAKLFLEDSILFAKVVDGELLLLVHPSGHKDQQELEWVEDSQRVQNP